MAVFSFPDKIKCRVAPKRIFQALILHLDEHYHTLLPRFISSVELIGGDGGPGSTKRYTFTRAVNLRPVEIKIEAVDKEKLTYRSTMINAESQLENLEAISFEVHFDATEWGGTKITTASTYYSKSGGQIIKENAKQHNERLMGKCKEIVRVLDDYLLQNPDIYA